jgi:hypothetical protein
MSRDRAWLRTRTSRASAASGGKRWISLSDGKAFARLSSPKNSQLTTAGGGEKITRTKPDKGTVIGFCDATQCVFIKGFNFKLSRRFQRKSRI